MRTILFNRISFLLMSLLSSCASRSTQTPPPTVDTPVRQAYQPLAKRLPDSTLLYMKMDLKKLLDSIQRNMAFVDPELAQALVTEASQAWSIAKELLSPQLQIQPKLLDKIFESTLHAILLPWSRDRQMKTPDAISQEKYDPTFSLLMETEPNVARDFMLQWKNRLERGQERASTASESAWKQLEVEQGELISMANNLAIGQLGPYLIFSGSPPLDLWTTLIAPPESTLHSSIGYQRYDQQEAFLHFFINMPALLARAQTYPGQTQDSAQGGNENPIYPELFHLLSLDKLLALGGNVIFSSKADHTRIELSMGLLHDQPISKALTQLLEGGRPFRMPRGGGDLGMAFMLRFGLSEIFKEIIERLDPRAQQQYLASTSMVKTTLGYSIDEFLQLFSGDFYVFIDMNDETFKSFSRVTEWNDDDESRFQLLPPGFNLLFLLGIHDRDTLSKVMSRLFELGSSVPMLASAMDKRLFQNETVYLLRPPEQKPKTYVDEGLQVAMAVFDQHLAVGTWQTVTNMIRRQHSTPGVTPSSFESAIQKHPKANLMLSFTDEMVEQMEKIDSTPEDRAIIQEGIDTLMKQTGNNPAYQELGELLKRLFNLLDRFNKKTAERFKSDYILYGQHIKDAYELKIQITQTRREPI